MKKVVLILAIAMMWSAHSKASTDRDCVKYSASDAIAATNADDNTFSATFSGVAERKGNSNADCTASSYDARGFDSNGLHRNGTAYDDDGYNINGYNEAGYDKEGFNKKGWNAEGINKETGTLYDKDGFDVDKRDQWGIHRCHYDDNCGGSSPVVHHGRPS